MANGYLAIFYSEHEDITSYLKVVAEDRDQALLDAEKYQQMELGGSHVLVDVLEGDELRELTHQILGPNAYQILIHRDGKHHDN